MAWLYCASVWERGTHFLPLPTASTPLGRRGDDEAVEMSAWGSTVGMGPGVCRGVGL